MHACANTACVCTRVCYLRNPRVCGSLHACHTRVIRVDRLSCGWFVPYEEIYYAANNQKIADKKMDYQEGLEKSYADSAAQSHDSYMKDLENSSAQSRKSYINDPEKSCADSAARSRESYKKDLKKSRDDSAARNCESYWKDPEKSHAQNHKGYM